MCLGFQAPMLRCLLLVKQRRLVRYLQVVTVSRRQAHSTELESAWDDDQVTSYSLFDLFPICAFSHGTAVVAAHARRGKEWHQQQS